MNRINGAMLGAASLLAVMLSTGAAQADWCVDLRTGQNYDCAKEPPSPAGNAASSPATGELRDKLRRSLSAKSATTVDRLALARQAEDASMRADSALRSAQLASDPGEKAQAKRNYDAAMKDLRSSTRQLMDATTDPAQKQQLAKALQDSEARHAEMAKDAGISGAQPPAQTAAAPTAPTDPKGDIFSVCEAPEKGVTTCYEIARTGSECRKVFYQGGQRTWENPQMSTCSATDLQQRDAYFAGQPVGTGPEPDTRTAELAGWMSKLSPKCQQQVKGYLYNSRDSKTSRSAGQAAVKDFADMDNDCRQGLAELANTLGVEMPQRRLADGSRRAWSGAMADKPRETVNLPSGNDYTYADNGGDGWNTGEVLQTGVQIIGILGDLLGAFASGYAAGGGGYSSGPVYTRSYGSGGPSGSGYVYRGNSGGSNSTITGGRR